MTPDLRFMGPCQHSMMIVRRQECNSICAERNQDNFACVGNSRRADRNQHVSVSMCCCDGGVEPHVEIPSAHSVEIDEKVVDFSDIFPVSRVYAPAADVLVAF